MNSRRLNSTFVIAVIGLWGLVGSATAAAAPIWNLGIHHNETNFAPGADGPGSPEYWFSVENVGPDNSSGPVTLTVKLPGGLTRQEVRQANTTSFNASWDCPGSVGDTTIICTTSTSIPHHAISPGLVLVVNVDPGASGTLVTEATLSGGGAAAPVSASEPTQISSEAAPFGIVPFSSEADFLRADGLTPVREAGAHPDLLTVAFDFTSVADPVAGAPENKTPSGNLHDLRVDFPPGFVGYPAHVGECRPDQLLANACPRSSQVGRVDATVVPVSVLPSTTFTQISSPVYNMVHPKGVISDLAFQIANNPIHVRVSLDPARGYAIKSEVTGANETLPVFFQKMTLWGVPAAPSHNWERCPSFSSSDVSTECAAGVPEKPFLTLPSRCDVQHAINISEYDSWQDKGVYGPDIEIPLVGQLADCDKPPFEPSVEAQSTADRTNTPTGLNLKLTVPQELDPDEQATPPVKSMRLALPQGMTVSPTFATGLQSCTEAQIGLGNVNPVDCPDASRIGSVSVQTPMLEDPVEGSLYMAQQGANPFGAPLAIYLALRDTEERGILVKIPGRLDLNGSTGQITAVFEDLPQLPFEDVSVQLRGGDMAPLLSPPTCGSQPLRAQLTSWAQPNKLVEVGANLQVNGGANGSSCPSGLPGRPFGPAMNAGTLNPTAGAFSPFVFRLTRQDQDQELARLDTTLPSGLTAKIAGIPYCSETAIAAISAAEGTGRGELAKSSCPAGSRVGTVEVGVGAGASPAFFAGQAYLAGPYRDAPLSLAIVVPAVVGPFDFGNVVVRAGIKVDPQTAVVSVVSDPFPQIVHGVLLRARDIRLRMDRPNMILNPTSCDRTAINATAFGVSGAVASLASPFQVGGCRQLGFKPRLSLRLKGGTKRSQYPALRATLKARPGDANIARTSVALPRSEFLAQEHIRTICTRVQFAADACPKASVYGFAKAVTPLLDKPLQGPVYLRSSDNKLPDLVADLNGQFEITLVGRIDSKNRGIRTTFSVVPDAPVTRFTLKMQGGKKGLLVNSENICRRPGRALVKMVGHNGKTSLTKPRLAAKCRGDGS
jgi:hypothetical protein